MDKPMNEYAADAPVSYTHLDVYKRQSYESVAHATQEIAALRPDFMSVTYGAGGGTSEHTVNIAADLKKKYDVTVLTHLTCVSSTREHVAAMVKKYKDAGIENILALRGDIPEGGAPHSDYH